MSKQPTEIRWLLPNSYTPQTFLLFMVQRVVFWVMTLQSCKLKQKYRRDILLPYSRLKDWVKADIIGVS
jgi:hypothetical protein